MRTTTLVRAVLGTTLIVALAACGGPSPTSGEDLRRLNDAQLNAELASAQAQRGRNATVQAILAERFRNGELVNFGTDAMPMLAQCAGGKVQLYFGSSSTNMSQASHGATYIAVADENCNVKHVHDAHGRLTPLTMFAQIDASDDIRREMLRGFFQVASAGMYGTGAALINRGASSGPANVITNVVDGAEALAASESNSGAVSSTNVRGGGGGGNSCSYCGQSGM